MKLFTLDLRDKKQETIELYCNTDNNFGHSENEVKHQNGGVFYQIHVLNPALTLVQSHIKTKVWWEQDWKRYVDVVVKRTQTNIMKINLVELNFHLSEVGFDTVRIVTAHLPIINKTQLVVNVITTFAEHFCRCRFYVQAGHQQSNSVNFNPERNHLEAAQLEQLNLARDSYGRMVRNPV